MSWYRVGVISVVQNSTTVTGGDANFSANCRVGDAFMGPDGRWYEVVNIASDTVLSILPAYQGETVIAGKYSIAPMQGYVKAAADQLRSIVNDYGVKLAALGDTGNYDVLPIAKGGTGAVDARASLAALGGLAVSGGTLQGALNGASPATLASESTVPIGAAEANTVTITGTVTISAFDAASAGTRRTLIFANTLTLVHNATRLILPGTSDITTATGDVAEVESLGAEGWKCLAYFRAAEMPELIRSVTRGGTGVTSMAALLTNLNAAGNYARSNVLGAVSQSGGTPTGAVIEFGRNVNGSYIKYADGTMICWFYSSVSYGVNLSYNAGAGFYSAPIALTFPSFFATGVPVVIPAPITVANFFCWAALDAYNAGGTGCIIRLVSPSSAAAAYVSYVAIGRWL